MLPLNVRKNHHNKGFTLIETLIIVVIIGIGFAIATPSFLSAMEKFKLEQAVVEVRSTFREAQRQAIRTGTSCSVALNMGNNHLIAPCLNNGDRSLPQQVKLATNIELNSGTTKANHNQNNSYLVASTEMPSLTNLGLDDSNSSLYLASRSNSNNTCQSNQTNGQNTTCQSQSQNDYRDDDDDDSNTGKIASVSFGVLGTAEFKIVKPAINLASSIDPSAKIVFYISNSSQSNRKCIAISNTLGLTRAGTYNGSTTPEEITGSGICTATE
jgi:prepilin-type N-terminal cleavage/methylation domain-containing protein